jgi:hypothetical protein
VSARLTLSQDQLRQEVLLNLQQLISIVDTKGIMRSYLTQACLLQGAHGGLFVVNPQMSTQPGKVHGEYAIQTVGTIKAEFALHDIWNSIEVQPEWHDMVSIVRSLGWTSDNPRFSTSFGQEGTNDFRCIFGFVVRSNFGDVLGFILFVTDKTHPFELADTNVTVITELTIYRILEAFGIKQIYQRVSAEANDLAETVGRVFPALDEVYSSSVHDLNGALAAVSMQTQLLSAAAAAAAAAGSGNTLQSIDRTENITKSMQRADEFLSLSNSMVKTLVGEVDSTSMKELIDVCMATGMESLKVDHKIHSTVHDFDLPSQQSEKLLRFWLCHNLIRIGRISLEELETEVPDPRLKIALSAYVQGDMEVIELKMLKYSSFQLNAAKYGVFRPFQLGRRLNPPRRLVEGILNIIGGSIIEIEDDESFTYQMLLPISS